MSVNSGTLLRELTNFAGAKKASRERERFEVKWTRFNGLVKIKKENTLSPVEKRAA